MPSCGAKTTGVTVPGKGLRGGSNYAGSWNSRQFATDSYNLTHCGETWCVKPKSIYTNPAANFEYFNKTCGDPYTYYGYWYRRFPNQTKYLNCYFLPFSEPAYFRNEFGYVEKGSQKLCKPVPNMRFNEVDNGFKYFDRKINPVSVNKFNYIKSV